MNSYTVEQVELLQRLRRTGINAHQIIEGFNELDRLELDLQNLSELNHSNNDSLLLHNESYASNGNGCNEESSMLFSMALNHTLQQQSSSGVEKSILMPPIDEETQALAEELLLREDSAIQEMKDFVTQNGIRQHVIASMCQISQPYVSKFFSKNFQDLSVKIRRNMFQWYAQQIRNPILNIAATSNGKTKEAVDLEFMERRERFVFRSQHVKMLKMAFKQNSYPTLEERQDLANHLNETYARSVAKPVSNLDPKEYVTGHVLGTWFTNKRREGKMKGTLPKCMAPARRGRPFKYPQLQNGDETKVEKGLSQESHAGNKIVLKSEEAEGELDEFDSSSAEMKREFSVK